MLKVFCLNHYSTKSVSNLWFFEVFLRQGDNFFFIRVFSHGYWRLTGQQGKGGDHHLFHSTTSHPLANIQTLISNFAREMTITYFYFHRLYLPCWYSLRFTTLSNYCLIDRWCNVGFCLFTCWFDSRFLLQLFYTGNWWTQTRIDHHPCNTSEPTNQEC